MPNKIKNNLTRVRKERGLSIDDVARDLGISRATINNYENEKTPIKQATWFALAYYFETSVQYLKGEENSPILDMKKYDSNLFFNENDESMIPFETINLDAKYALIAINQTIKWIDSDNQLLNTAKPNKSEYVKTYELTLLKNLRVGFESMRNAISFGVGFAVKDPDKYLFSIKGLSKAATVFNQFNYLDKKTQESIYQLVQKLYKDGKDIKSQNKKASDD